MRPTRRDDLGEILPIDVRMQPRKVVKHFYNPVERWDQLVDIDMQTLVDEARAAGWGGAVATDEAPAADSRGAVALRRHHDMHYAPVYLDALAAETTRWAPQTRVGAARALACSVEGVLVAFDRGPRCKVVTAFRPDLPMRGVHPTNEDFVLEARRRWRLSVDRTERRLEEDLADAVASDQGDVLSAWRLAVALGRARGSLVGVPSPLTAKAETHLHAVDHDTRRALLASIDEEDRLDALTDAILEGDGAETLDRLLALEDVVAAALALGDVARAERLTEEAAVRVSCAGPELVGLAADAEERAAAAPQELSRYWRELGTEILANAIRLAPPARTRNELPAFASAWLQTLLASTRATLASLIDAVSVASPALSRHEHAQEIVAEGSAVSGAMLRAFVVDRDHPSGEDVSDMISHQGARWSFRGWLVEPDDGAVLVVIAVEGRGTAEGRPLADLLAHADESQQIDTAPLKAAR